jgi:tRNA-dihydrouridine synthase B
MPPDEHPSSVQIFGHEPSVMAEAAPMALELSGADMLDINMVCPVGKIVKGGDGSALMREPELAGKIVEAVVKAVSVPVTVKFRKGFDGGHANAVEFARICESAGASALAIHGRTRAQMYAGRADWDVVRDAAAAVKIPVIANGDVFTAEDAVRILRYTGCPMAMIGRGAFGDPWLFERANAALAGEEIPAPPPLSVRLDEAVGQIELLASVRGERAACLEARHHLPWYLRGVPHSAVYRAALTRVETLGDIRALAKEMKRDLRDEKSEVTKA